MALVTVPGGLWLPSIPLGFANGTPGFSSLVIDAANEAVSNIFYAPFTGNLRKVHFHTNTVTTGATVDVRVETVDLTTGDPTGTLFGTTTNGSVVIADSDDNVIKTATLTADAAVTKGTSLLGISIVNPAASFGNMQIAFFNEDTNNHAFPYGDHFTAAWAKQAAPIVMAIEDDGGVIYSVEGLRFLNTVTSTAFNSGSTPDVWGIRFKFPFKCKVDGAWAHTAVASTADVTFKLYDSDGVSVIGTADLDPQVRQSLSGRGLRFPFTNDEPTLNADTFYYLGIEPSTANSATVYRYALPSEASMSAWPLGNNCHVASAKNPTGTGSWTHYNNGTDGYERMPIGLHISQVDDGTGAGGSGGAGGHALWWAR